MYLTFLTVNLVYIFSIVYLLMDISYLLYCLLIVCDLTRVQRNLCDILWTCGCVMSSRVFIMVNTSTTTKLTTNTDTKKTQ